MHVGDRRVVEVPAPDEGRESGQECLAGLAISGAHARLDHRRPLPVLPDALIVGGGGGHGDGDGGRPRIGPQPKVDAEDVAVLGSLRQETDDLLRHAHENRAGLQPLAQPRRVGVVEDDDVDVGGVVQLAGPVLSHRQGEEADALLGIGGVVELYPAGTGRIAQQPSERRGQRAVRGSRQGPRHRLDAPHPAEVAERDEQRRLLLQEPKRAHCVRLRLRALAFGPSARDGRRECLGWIRPQEAVEARGVGDAQAPKIWRARRDAGDEPARGSPRAQGAPQDGGVPANLGRKVVQTRRALLGVRVQRRGAHLVDEHAHAAAVRLGSSITAIRPGPLSSSRSAPP